MNNIPPSPSSPSITPTPITPTAPKACRDTQPVLEIKDMDFIIDQAHILHSIDLTVRKGEFIGLIGPNGAGKTSLLKCINKINASSGEINVNGKNISSLSEKKIALDIALMHQDIHINFPFPAFDIVLMGRYPYIKLFQGESREDIRIARESMQYTDTLKFEKKPVTRMSGGERQRVIFAKVLTQQTEILLLDEPAASLDITHQEQIFKYSRDLCESGKTVITAIHDLKMASRYCSRLILLKDGRIIADGSPEEVVTRENIRLAYGVDALVYRNNISGSIDFHISSRETRTSDTIATGTSAHFTSHASSPVPSVHVIGGVGKASEVIRILYENGYDITAGVFQYGDADAVTARIYSIDFLETEPFAAISPDLHEMNKQKVEKADITILCRMPVGPANLRNLEAAASARRLLIISDVSNAPGMSGTSGMPDMPNGTISDNDLPGCDPADLYTSLEKKALKVSLPDFKASCVSIVNSLLSV